MGEESEAFKALFSNGVSYMDGGVNSGFKHVVPEGYDTKMYQVRKVKGTVEIIQAPLHTNVIHKGDCFILDAPDWIYVLEGDASTHFERQAANTQAEQIEANRASDAKV